MKSFLVASIIVAHAGYTTASCSCSTKLSCDELYSDNWESLYSISTVSGPWSDLVSLDNSGGSGDATYTVSYNVGYSSTTSVSVEDKWSAEAGVSFSGFAAKGGYSETITALDSSTWSTSTTQTFSITVPAGKSVRYWQRDVQFNLISGAKVCTLLDQDFDVYLCMAAQDQNLIYSAKMMGCESTCKVCSYNTPTTKQKLSFKTTCYSSQADETERDDFCPIPGVDSTTTNAVPSGLRGSRVNDRIVNFTASVEVGDYSFNNEHGEKISTKSD